MQRLAIWNNRVAYNIYEEAGDMICRKCGQDKEEFSSRDKNLCVDCAKAEASRVTYYRQHQRDWLAEAKEQGLVVWLQQPGETQWEYTVWTAYRDSYPGKRPSYASVAEQLGTSYGVVSKIAQRWSFPVRMQMWIAECDKITMLQRREEILNMNKAHVDMAVTLRNKLDIAIGLIDPETLKPSEIASLAKLSAEMERKARIDTEAQEELRSQLLVDTGNVELKKAQTKQSDLSEVLQILIKSGAMVGIKETREIVVKEEE